MRFIDLRGTNNTQIEIDPRTGKISKDEAVLIKPSRQHSDNAVSLESVRQAFSAAYGAHHTLG